MWIIDFHRDVDPKELQGSVLANQSPLRVLAQLSVELFVPAHDLRRLAAICSVLVRGGAVEHDALPRVPDGEHAVRVEFRIMQIKSWRFGSLQGEKRDQSEQTTTTDPTTSRPDGFSK